MLQSIVKWSLHNRPVVLALAVALVVVGIFASFRSDLDAFPEFAPPQVTVQTEAVGLSAEEVEQLITLPLEQSIVGLPGLESLRSRSIQGLSAITVVFKDNVDVYLARQLVGQKLTEAQALLPDTAEIPRMGPMTKTTGRLLVIGFTSDNLDAIELRDRVQWDVRPRVLALQGVAMTTIFGGDVRQYQVQVSPEQLAARGLGINDIVETAKQASKVRGIGFQENVNQRVVVRAEGQIRSESQLADTVLNRNFDGMTRLGDIGKITQAPAPQFGSSTVNGKSAVSMLIYKQFGSDTLAVTRSIEAEFKRMQSEIEKQGIEIRFGLFRQADFIEKAIGNVVESLWLGAVLVTVILTVLLMNMRVAFISLVAIPLSLLTAISVLWFCNVSLNTLTLGGLAIAVGEVVDDAVIDVENIFRRFREAKAKSKTFDPIKIALDASLEVRSAVVYATWIVVAVFVPVLLMGGVQGRLFAPLGYAYILATVSSLLVALTVTPVMSVVLLRNRVGSHDPIVLKFLQNIYEAILRLTIRWRYFTVVAVTIATGFAMFAITESGGEFLPELRESHLIVHMQSLSGTSLNQNVLTGQQVTRTLLAKDGVANVCHLAGRAEQGEDTWGIEYGEIEVPLKSHADVEQLRNDLLEELPLAFPGNNFHAFTFLSECIHDSLSGSIAPVLVKVKGTDFAAVDAIVPKVAFIMRQTPGNQGVFAEPQDGQPEMVIRVRHGDAALYGLRPAEIIDCIHTAYQGAVVGQVYDRNRVTSIVVVLDPAIRNRPELIEQLWLTVPMERRPIASPNPNPLRKSPELADEGRVQLSQVADVFLSDGRFLVTHENGIRTQAISCAATGRDVESFVRDLEDRISKLPRPAGVQIEITGEHIAKKAAQSDLLVTGAGAALAVVLLLWMALRTYGATLLVLLNIPFALIGGVFAVYWMGNVLNVGSLVGFVTLFGITMRNGIMMVTHWQHLALEGSNKHLLQLILQGARERLGPILMTALVTGLGLAPIAIWSHEAGREIEGPMAIVILGGLFTSTLLNLFILPVFAFLFGGKLFSSQQADAATLM
jgi:CzcA family heavy metal efflux pump